MLSGTVPFAKIQEVPVFPECQDAEDMRSCFQERMIAHVKKHFNYPEAAQELGLQGRVAVLLVIDAKGGLGALATRGPHALLEAEAERIMKRLPKMAPGREAGEAVSVAYSIPITFKLR